MAIAFPWGQVDHPNDFQYVYITRTTNCGTVDILRQYCIDGQKLDKHQKLLSSEAKPIFLLFSWLSWPKH